MHFKKLLFILVSMLSFSVAVFAAEINFPSPTGYVNDYAGILTADQKQSLDQITQSLKQTNGAELAIAIVDSVEPLDSKLYAVKLFEKWKIGEKGKDNGVLVLLAIKERRIEIEVGYGLEGVLPDALAGQILDDHAVPNFREGKMGEGVIETAKAIASVVAKEENAPQLRPKTSDESGMMTFYFIIILMLVIVIGIYGAAKERPLSLVFGIFGTVFGFAFIGLMGGLLGAAIGLILGFIFKIQGGGDGGGWTSSSGSFGGGFGGSSGGSSSGGFGGGSSGGGGAGRSW
jgi:uncharacterized protein